jgi:hypothetical protein
LIVYPDHPSQARITIDDERMDCICYMASDFVALMVENDRTSQDQSSVTQALPTEEQHGISVAPLR